MTHTGAKRWCGQVIDGKAATATSVLIFGTRGQRGGNCGTGVYALVKCGDLFGQPSRTELEKAPPSLERPSSCGSIDKDFDILLTYRHLGDEVPEAVHEVNAADDIELFVITRE